MNIGAKIVEMRKERNMTQEEFAKIFHVTRQTVSNWENQKSYPDLQTLVQMSDEFGVSLDRMLKEDAVMVKKIDDFKKYKKVCIGVTAGILTVGILGCVYTGICKVQHKNMYNKVEQAGFVKENTEKFIEKYQGNYALTEEGIDYLVMPKEIGTYELDTENFQVIARKGNQDLTIRIDEDRKIFLALYPGKIEVDEKGNERKPSKKLTEEQKMHRDVLLKTRKEEMLPMIHRALEFWDEINR